MTGGMTGVYCHIWISAPRRLSLAPRLAAALTARLLSAADPSVPSLCGLLVF